MKKLIPIFLFQMFAVALAGQTASKGWEVFYSGNSGGADRIEDVLVDNSHVVSVGRLYKNADETVLIAKYTLAGQQVWAKSWAITGLDLYPYYIQKGINGNYYVLGYGDSGEHFIVQFDTNGNFVEAKVLSLSTANDFKILADGSFIVAGENNDKPYLWKFDQNLNQVWAKALSFSFPQGIYGTAGIYAVDAAADGGFYVLTRGTSIISNTSSDDVIVGKTDAQGNLLWNKVFGGTKGDYIADSYDNQVRSRIVGHPDGGFVFECNTRSLEFAPAGITTLNELLVIKGDVNGNQQWWRTSGGGAINANGIAIKPNGNILVFGKGTTSQSSPFYTPTDLSDRAYIFEVKNQNGQTVWGSSFGGAKSDFTRGLAVLNNSKLFAGGSNDENAWLFSVNISGVTSLSETASPEPLDCFPNPAGNQLTVSLEDGTTGQVRVYDLQGQMVLEKSIEPGSDGAHLDISRLSKGIYTLLLLEPTGTIRSGKFAKAY